MTVFPELQTELVDAARRRHGRAPRTWRIARRVLVAAACAATIAAIVFLTGRGTTGDERPAPAATPAPTVLERHFGVFRRPATPADALPAVDEVERYWMLREDVAAFDPSQARLVAQDGDSRVFLVGMTSEGRPWVNAILFYKGHPKVGGGGVIDDRGVVGGVVEPPDGRHPAVVVAAVADGIGEVLVTYADHTTDRLPVRDNVAYAPLDRRPVSLAWDDANGVRHSEAVPVPPDRQRRDPAVPTPTPTPASATPTPSPPVVTPTPTPTVG